MLHTGLQLHLFLLVGGEGGVLAQQVARELHEVLARGHLLDGHQVARLARSTLHAHLRLAPERPEGRCAQVGPVAQWAVVSGRWSRRCDKLEHPRQWPGGTPTGLPGGAEPPRAARRALRRRSSRARAVAAKRGAHFGRAAARLAREVTQRAVAVELPPVLALRLGVVQQLATHGHRPRRPCSLRRPRRLRSPRSLRRPRRPCRPGRRRHGRRRCRRRRRRRRLLHARLYPVGAQRVVLRDDRRLLLLRLHLKQGR
jgi:hypothetical protein